MSKKMRKFRLIDYEVEDGHVVIKSGTLQELIEKKPLQPAVFEDISPCDLLTVGNTIWQMQSNRKFRAVNVCGRMLHDDLILIKRNRRSQ